MGSDSDNEAEMSMEKPSSSLDSSDTPKPTKRLKTLTLTLSPTSSSLKGKEKIERIKDEFKEEAMDSQSKLCGICLSDDGKKIRGWIDSCDHYFCFVCIMEWSKIESRCPMCKQRFGIIRRPPVDGAFLHERIVKVPVRDQVYHPLGNASTAPFDPYARVECRECHGMEDENLLLLCDLCDSAAHTYCVGLGNTVPEGDWYCHDCTVSRDEHSNDQIDTVCDNQSSSRNIDISSFAETHVSVFDIVRESNTPEVERPPRTPIVPDGDINAPPRTPIIPDLNVNAGTREAEPSARTLRCCRKLHRHIHALRENWNALRSGSLGFSSSLLDSSGQSNTKHNSREGMFDKSSQPQPSSSTSCQHMTNKDSVSMLSNAGLHDIDRAWKMMDIARSVQWARRNSSIDHQPSICPSGTINGPKEATNKNSSFLSSKNKPSVHKHLGSIASKKNHECQFLEMAQDHKYLKSGKLKLGRETVKESTKFDVDRPSTYPSEYCKLPSARQVQTSIDVDICHENGGQTSQEVLHGASSNLNNVSDGSACAVFLSKSLPEASDLSCHRSELVASSGCWVEPSKGKGMDKNPAEGMTRKDDHAKSEVQSLVRLNLKLLSRDKQLGADGFKEVARLATHTILAACGLEHKKSIVRPFPNVICKHAEQRRQFRMCNLMPTSCRECFYIFVKDVVNTILVEKIVHVVNSIMVEKIDHAESSS